MLLDATHYRLKISDLGITKAAIAGTSGKITFPYTSSRGSLGYVAPEVVNGDEENFTKAVDVFGLGRSVWSMVYREDPDYTMKVADTLINNLKVPVEQEIWFFILR